MAESFPMNGGDGVYSYTKNSQNQKKVSDFAKEMIKEAILEKLDTDSLNMSISTTFRIGCSVGPNTFFAVQNLIESIQKKWSFQGLGSRNVEFQVFFNDHMANDFNTLFASLPLDRQYNAVAAPGSFYGRLFPRASISLAYSSYALQWLSRVPEKSTACNKGRLHYPGAPGEVVNAYADHFEKDMGVFINSRAEEIVAGGLMVLIIPVTPDEASHLDLLYNFLFNFLGSMIIEMATEGIIDKAEIDAFNLPIYFPTVEEITQVIEKNGCFSIERIELIKPLSQNSESLNVHRLIMHVRAGLEGILTQHFGHDAVEKLFEKTSAKTEEISQLLKSDRIYLTEVFVVLKRK